MRFLKKIELDKFIEIRNQPLWLNENIKGIQEYIYNRHWENNNNNLYFLRVITPT